MAIDAGQLIQGLIKGFPPEKAAGLKAEIQLHLTGEGGGDWAIHIADSKISADPGTAPSPQLTITAGLADILAITEGKLGGTAAFLQGKIKLSGDTGLAMRMVSLFQHS
ncbi:MAG: SCP2 sterol-binding domain-containing protein [Anaerolineales bacterium]|jgi:putative sterol carrier protein